MSLQVTGRLLQGAGADGRTDSRATANIFWLWKGYKPLGTRHAPAVPPSSRLSPPGLSHCRHERLSHQNAGFGEFPARSALAAPGLSLGSAAGSAGRAARNGSIQISAPRSQGTTARVSLGGSSCARGRGRPPNTLPLVRLGRGSGGAAGISCRRPRPATPAKDARLQPTSPGPPRDRAPLGDKAGTRRGCLAPKGHQQLDALPPHPAVRVLLERISLCGSKSQLKRG